jgi:D-alanyl-lipoteichoic acid acyltransferase DltB (MBOAT superfamily)
VNFVSWAFVALFAVVFVARLTIGRRKVEPLYLALLLGASLIFYSWHIPPYLFVLLATTAIDFIAARAMARTPDHARRAAWLALSIVSNLGLLAFFKYAGFFAKLAEDVSILLGRPLRIEAFELLLPMGISFYTFQTLSYTIDVYRRAIAPVRNFDDFLLFVSFFPQLVAGPIVRASEFLPQLPRPRRLRLRVFYQGMWLLITGFFLKMVCADNLAAYVDEHWERGMQAGTPASVCLWLAVMFSGQIFADFSGYSLIARGLGYLLGFRFPVNFNAPYIASTFKNFWERWHITLSRWLRDYLYVPLGGNRRSRLRTLVNLIVVMLFGGLWHGAAYTFIAWGAIHGAGLALERVLGLHREAPRRPLLVRLGWSVAVQGIVLAAWVFFRSPTIDGASTFLANLVRGDWTPTDTGMGLSLLFLSPLVALHAWSWLQERGHVTLGHTAQAVLAAAMTYAIVAFHGATSDFIYFQF